MSQGNHEIGEGVFIRFKPDEAKEVWSALSEMGYAADGTGMREFVLDSLFETEKEPAQAGPLEELIAQNPEAIRQAGAAIVDFARRTINRYRRQPE